MSTVVAALQLKIPTVIHEQNAVLGLANRLLAPKVTRVCTSFELAKKIPKEAEIIRTGQPQTFGDLGVCPRSEEADDGGFRLQ